MKPLVRWENKQEGMWELNHGGMETVRNTVILPVSVSQWFDRFQPMRVVGENTNKGNFRDEILIIQLILLILVLIQ